MWAQTCDATHELLLKLYYVTPTPLSSPSNHVNSSERSVLINRSQRRLFFASSYCAGMSKPEESALLSPITLVLINTTLMPPLFSEPLQNKGLRMGGMTGEEQWLSHICLHTGELSQMRRRRQNYFLFPGVKKKMENPPAQKKGFASVTEQDLRMSWCADKQINRHRKCCTRCAHTHTH